MKHSAKILARFIIADPTIRTYADIGRKAFGNRSTHFVSLLFCLELFTVTVALVTLYADSLGEFSSSLKLLCPTADRFSTEMVEPMYSATFYKILGLIVYVRLGLFLGA